MTRNNVPVIFWKVRYSPKWNHAIIAVVALIVQGPILLMDGIYWDGWLIYTYLAEKNWNNIIAMFIESGSPTTLYLHWFMGYLPNIILGYRLLAFVSIACSGLLVYLIGNEIKWVNSTENLWIALLSLAYPANQVAFEVINAPSVFYLCLFYSACLLALRAERVVGFGHYGLRASAVLLFLISFTVNSLLVFYFGFLLLLVLVVRRLQSRSLREIITRFLPHHLDYILLPFLYWIAKDIFFPPYGQYAYYNQFQLSIDLLIANTRAFLINSIYEQFNTIWHSLAGHPLFWLLAIAFTTLMYLTFRGDTRSGSAQPTVRSSFALLLVGIFFLVLSIFPYVVVGLSPSGRNFTTRHALLIGLPVGIMLVALTGILFTRASMRAVKFVILSMLCLGFGMVMIGNYIDWQNRWVKDLSVITHLSISEKATPFSVFVIEDHLPIPGTHDYRVYDYSSMFNQVWGHHARIGFERGSRDMGGVYKWLESLSPELKKSFLLENLDPLGCQAALTIEPGPQWRQGYELTLNYFVYRFFYPKQLRDFLLGVTHVTLTPLETAAPVKSILLGCKAPAPTDYSVIDLTNQVHQKGSITTWDVYAIDTDSVRLKVWRKQSGQWIVVAQSSLLAVTTGVTHLTFEPPLEVWPGDYLGFYSREGWIRPNDLETRSPAGKPQVVFSGDVLCGLENMAITVPFELDIKVHLSKPIYSQAEAFPSYSGVSSVQLSFVDFSKPIDTSGRIVGWVVNVAGQEEMRLKVWRKVGDKWEVVGESAVERPALGLNRFSITEGLEVQPGDYLGFYSNWHDTVPFPILAGGCSLETAGSKYVTGDFHGQIEDYQWVDDRHTYQFYVLYDRLVE